MRNIKKKINTEEEKNYDDIIEKYYFECNGKNINLCEFINNYYFEDKTIIYIKHTNNIDINGDNHLKVRNKKAYDFHINYNNIREKAFINVSINISDKKKDELKNTIENVNKYILEKNPNININPLYIENPNKKNNNKITFNCKFIPDLKSKNHRIYEIKEYLTKLLWNKNNFPFERVKKGWTDLAEFKNKMIEANKKNHQLKIYPDFELVLKIQNINNDIILTLEYNIRQIYFVKPNIIPDPII